MLLNLDCVVVLTAIPTTPEDGLEGKSPEGVTRVILGRHYAPSNNSINEKEKKD